MNFLQFISAIITIATAVANISFSLTLDVNDDLNYIKIFMPSYVVGVFIFIYLEIVISTMLSIIKIKVFDVFFKNRNAIYNLALLPFVIALFIVSAWTTIFNMEILIFQNDFTYSEFILKDYLMYLFWCFISIIIMMISSGNVRIAFLGGDGTNSADDAIFITAIYFIGLVFVFYLKLSL